VREVGKGRNSLLGPAPFDPHHPIVAAIILYWILDIGHHTKASMRKVASWQAQALGVFFLFVREIVSSES